VPPCPVVVSVHDLTFYRFPQWFRPFNWRYLQRFTRQTVRHAHHIIASSQHTRQDLITLLDVPPERISVIPLGVGEEMRPMQDTAALAALRHKRQLPERMILYLGTLEPRKNLTTLLEAYALLRRDPGFHHRLVIAGGKGWYYEEIEATVARLHLGQAVLFAGYVPQEELPWWYNAADVFVYPSLYEGFGLPPLEAMACGVPVVVSAASSLPEVVGEAGVIVPPLDAQALAEAIREVVEDGPRRQRLIAAGLARAQALSWRATAAKTAKLYRHLLTEAQG